MTKLLFHPTFILFLLLPPLFYAQSSYWLIALFFWLVAVVIHEATHQLVWYSLGYQTRIELHLYGATTEAVAFRDNQIVAFPIATCKPIPFKVNRLHQSLNSLAAPSSNFLAILIACSVFDPTQPLTRLWIESNLYLAIYQLLPVESLDGWVLLSNLLSTLLGNRGVQISYAVTFLFALSVSMALLLFAPSLGVLPFLLGFSLTFQSFLKMREQLRLDPFDLDESIQKSLKEAKGLLEKGQIIACQRLLEPLLEKKRGRLQSGKILIESALLLAECKLRQGEPQEAWQLASALPTTYLGDLALLKYHQIAYQCEQFEVVRKLGSQLFQIRPEASTAMIQAITASRLYEEATLKQKNAKKCRELMEEAIGWLKAAKRLQFFPWNLLEGADFKALQSEPLFQEFVRTLPKKLS